MFAIISAHSDPHSGGAAVTLPFFRDLHAKTCGAQSLNRIVVLNEDVVMSDRIKGIVKWFNNAKGFGFITHDGGDDVFVHFRSIRGDGYRTLTQGQQVEFAMQAGPKGLHAEDVDKV